MRPPVYSTSMSFHRIFRSSLHPVLRVWKQQLPMVHPCYSLSKSSTEQTIAIMREHRIPMLCETPGQVKAVNDYMLTIENTCFGGNEYIAREIHDHPVVVSAPLWIYTKISHDGIEHTRKMFEHIWAHKYILKGLVFDINNFSNSSRGSIPPSKYSYKVALDYIFRNMVRPFEKEYGIQTPCIMMDGRHHITQIDHLEELKTYIEPVIVKSNQTQFQLIVGDIFDHHEK